MLLWSIVSIFFMMKRSFIKSAALLTLVVVALKILPIGQDYGEFLPIGFSFVHILKSHDCSGKEVHRGLEEKHLCSICHRHFSADGYLSPIAVSIASVAISLDVAKPSLFISEDFFASASKRGPPHG